MPLSQSANPTPERFDRSVGSIDVAVAVAVAAAANDRTAHAALGLYAQVLGARSVEAAAHLLVNLLSTQFCCARATLGLHEENRTTLLASSYFDIAKPKAEQGARLVGAMDEAIDQAVSLQCPSPALAGEQDPTAPGPIRVEIEALQRLLGGVVAVVPLGLRGNVFGALCIERDNVPFSTAELRAIEDVLALALPALQWMREGSESTLRRLRRDLARTWHRLRQPDRASARRLWVIGALAVLFLAAAPLEREVAGRARIEGAEQRVLVAPTDGFIKLAHVRPGDRVKQNAPLVDLLEGDLRLEHERWSSQLAQHENAYAAAMAKGDRTTASTSLARITEAQAQLALVGGQLSRGRITAPFDALVVQGDLSQSIGMPVRQGDTLLTLATTGRQRVIVQIDEVDIARVQPGQAGELAVSSLPWDRHDLVVERITPLAKAVDGRNVFEVEARLLAVRDDLRPGLLGRASLVVGRMPPLWVWTAHALDRARVTWWSWLG